MKYATIPAILLALALPAGPALGDAHGGAAGHAMDNARIDALLRALDAGIEGRPGFWYLEMRGHPVYVVTDEAADRMRIIVQIAPASQLTRCCGLPSSTRSRR
jgi:hypothetical protein